MIRTRDYLLLLLAIAFLLVGIGGTLIDRYAGKSENDTESVEFVETSTSEYGAVINNDLKAERENRLAELRKKIAKHSNLFIAENLVETSEIATSSDEEIMDEPPTTIVQQCGNYTTYNTPWVVAGLRFEVVEGARVLYRTGTTLSESASSTETAVLYLPLSSLPSASTACLETDVVGFTLGGSLIRNNDAALFKAAGPDTLLGYALDGFPIYGSTDASLDTCGGRQVAGKYQYQLSPDQDTVLRCFSGNPISF